MLLAVFLFFFLGGGVGRQEEALLFSLIKFVTLTHIASVFPENHAT